jgi:hypothetical protein
MGFKANIDIALSFSSLKICSVRQQGRIKFRICLYYTTHNDQVFIFNYFREKLLFNKYNSVIPIVSFANKINIKTQHNLFKKYKLYVTIIIIIQLRTNLLFNHLTHPSNNLNWISVLIIIYLNLSK